MAVFTDKFLRGLRPRAQRYEKRDRGCPGLLLRVNQDGGKVWEVIATENGKRRRIRLGEYPGLSLAMARRMAAERKAAPDLYRQQLKVRDLFDQYAREVEGNLRSFKDVRSVWEQWAEPAVGNVRLNDLNLRHGADLIEQVSTKSSPNRAAKVIRYLNPMLSYAAGRGMIPGNPWAGLHLPSTSATRDRVLRREEWNALWDWGCDQEYPWGPFLHVLMLSAQRLNEVAKMQWTELDGDVWTIPAARHKSKRLHEVSLPDQLRRIIEAQPRTGEFVFSSRAGAAIAPGSKLASQIQAATKTSDWRFHDLRRTGATYMTEGGATRFIVERVLGHSDGTVTARYDRNSYREEKRAALALLEIYS